MMIDRCPEGELPVTERGAALYGVRTTDAEIPVLAQQLVTEWSPTSNHQVSIRRTRRPNVQTGFIQT